MIYKLPLPPNFRLDVDDAGTIHNWLTSQECFVASVSILQEDDIYVVHVESLDDPSPHFQTYPRTVTPKEELAEALDELDLENASVDELKTAVILLRALTKQ